MESMINIGATQEVVGSVHKAILAIIQSTNAEAVKIAALEALKTVCQVDSTNMSIMNCNFTAMPKEKKHATNKS